MGMDGQEQAAAGNFVRGALWMIGAMAGFAFLIGIIRHVSAELHPFEVAFFRNAFGLVFMLPWLMQTRLQGLRTQRLPLHLLRAVLGLAAMLAWFWAVVHMPLAEAVALNFTTPLFTTVLAIPLLGEVVRLRRWSATIVGFLGTLVILQPGVEAVTGTAMLVLLASLLMASAGICIKKLSRTESSNAIVAYMVLFLTPLSLVPALFVWTWPALETWPWLVAAGLLATLSHQCLARAFAETDTSALMPFDYVRLPFVAAIGYVAFGEPVDPWTWVGAAIIAASGAYIAHREAVLGRARTVPLTAGEGALRPDRTNR